MSATPKRRLPKRRSPSARDDRIYAEHKVHARTQVELAAEHGLSRGRVSQIVAKVAQWRADAGPREGELKHDQRQRLERGLERERMELLYAQSLRMLKEFEKPATTVRGGARKGEEWSEETKREQPNTRLQALKAAMRAAESLGKMADREGPPDPPDESEPAIKGHVLFWELVRKRREAEEKGYVPKCQDTYWIIYYLQRALQGDTLPSCEFPGVKQALAMLGEALTAVGSGGQWLDRRSQESAARLGNAGVMREAKSTSEGAKRAKPLSAEPGDLPTAGPAATAVASRETAGGCAAHPVSASMADRPGLAPDISAEFSALRGNSPAATPAEVDEKWAAARAAYLEAREQRLIEAAARQYEEARAKEEEREYRRQRARERDFYAPPLDLGYQPAPRDEQDQRERQKA